MSRSYRMRYHGISDPYIADPIKIIVNLFNGSQHVLLSEHAGETFLDVKRAILPHLPHDIPNFGLHHIMFLIRGHGKVDDRATVSSLALDNPNVVELELLFIDPIRVNIETMYADSYYTFFINDPDATLLDVKRLVLPLIEFPLINHDAPRPLLDELYFEGVVDDNTLVSSLAHNNIVQLELSPIL